MPATRYEQQSPQEILRKLKEAEPGLYNAMQKKATKAFLAKYKHQSLHSDKAKKYLLAAACTLLQHLAEQAQKRASLKQSIKYIFQAIKIARLLKLTPLFKKCLDTVNMIAEKHRKVERHQEAMQYSRRVCELATYCSATRLKNALTIYCNAFSQLKNPADIAPAQEDAQALIKDVYNRLQCIKAQKPGLSYHVNQCGSYLMQMRTLYLSPDALKTMTISDPSHSEQSLAQVIETFRAAQVTNSTPDDMDRFIRLATPPIRDPDTSQAIKADMMAWLTNTERESWNRKISGCKRPSLTEKLHRIERLNKLATLAKTCEKPLPSSPAITCAGSQEAATSSKKWPYASMTPSSEG